MKLTGADEQIAAYCFKMTLQANHELLTLTLPQGWLTQHPLGKEIIAQESQWQSYVHWPLEVH